jgi:hypothetical protein
MHRFTQFDGEYIISYQVYAHEVPKCLWVNSVFAEATINQGILKGKDELGGIWTATLEYKDVGSIAFCGEVDISKAPAKSYIFNKSGELTKLTQKYKGLLSIKSLKRCLVFTGLIHHGIMNIKIQMRRKQVNSTIELGAVAVPS